MRRTTLKEETGGTPRVDRRSGTHTSSFDETKESGPTGAQHPSNDFIWTDVPYCHSVRQREMIKKYGKEINQLMGIEWKTKYIVPLVVLTQMAAGVWARNLGWIPFFLLAYVVGGTCIHNLFLAI